MLEGNHTVDTADTDNSHAGRPGEIADAQVADYCRDIETYLCRKNDGHLIRVVGPSFEMVSRWARDGVPLKVACGGIDRYFERYYRKGPRRRPVRIDFCEADVLDVFDEWRRATGLTARADQDPAAHGVKRTPSLPEHLERVLIRLTNAQATGALGANIDPLIDQLSAELDRARATAGGVRGEARRAMCERLAAADQSLLSTARAAVAPADLDAFRREVEASLGSMVEQMPPDALARARDRALDQLVRERFHLPTILFA
jgi:hypothetical protein